MKTKKMRVVERQKTKYRRFARANHICHRINQPSITSSAALPISHRIKYNSFSIYSSKEKKKRPVNTYQSLLFIVLF